MRHKFTISKLAKLSITSHWIKFFLYLQLYVITVI